MHSVMWSITADVSGCLVVHVHSLISCYSIVLAQAQVLHGSPRPHPQSQSSFSLDTTSSEEVTVIFSQRCATFLNLQVGNHVNVHPPWWVYSCGSLFCLCVCWGGGVGMGHWYGCVCVCVCEYGVVHCCLVYFLHVHTCNYTGASSLSLRSKLVAALISTYNVMYQYWYGRMLLIQTSINQIRRLTEHQIWAATPHFPMAKWH